MVCGDGGGTEGRKEEGREDTKGRREDQVREERK